MGTKPKARSGPLDNPRHEAFAQAIVRGLNALAAYEYAGFKPHPANPYRLRDSERICRRINELRGRLFTRIKNRLDLDAKRLTKEFGRIGLAKITDVVAIKDGQVLVQDTTEISEDTAAAISEIRQTKDGIVVKMHDKTAALTSLGKHLGYFPKEVANVQVTVSLAELVNLSYGQNLPQLPETKIIDGEVEK